MRVASETEWFQLSQMANDFVKKFNMFEIIVGLMQLDHAYFINWMRNRIKIGQTHLDHTYFIKYG